MHKCLTQAISQRSLCAKWLLKRRPQCVHCWLTVRSVCCEVQRGAGGEAVPDVEAVEQDLKMVMCHIITAEMHFGKENSALLAMPRPHATKLSAGSTSVEACMSD